MSMLPHSRTQLQVLRPPVSTQSETRRQLNNLPFQLTSFIGREREIAEVRHLLASARLVTLTGAGGCGKTRLAMQVTADLSNETRMPPPFPDGAWLIEFAPLFDPSL